MTADGGLRVLATCCADSCHTVLAEDDLASVQRALISALDLLEHDLPTLADGTFELTPQQRGVLFALRGRISDGQ